VCVPNASSASTRVFDALGSASGVPRYSGAYGLSFTAARDSCGEGAQGCRSESTEALSGAIGGSRGRTSDQKLTGRLMHKPRIGEAQANGPRRRSRTSSEIVE